MAKPIEDRIAECIHDRPSWTNEVALLCEAEAEIRRLRAEVVEERNACLAIADRVYRERLAASDWSGDSAAADILNAILERGTE